MHASNFLHRDIAPDNIIVRLDGTPVLLDFGAARNIVKQNRALTGIVKAGYSPHEQYATDSRLQGPWSDLYAFGGTLYRAIMGWAPDEATVRISDDRMRRVSQAGENKGRYRTSFLKAIDACLMYHQRHAELDKPFPDSGAVVGLGPVVDHRAGERELCQPLNRLQRVVCSDHVGARLVEADRQI